MGTDKKRAAFLTGLDANYRLIISLAIGLIAFFIFKGNMSRLQLILVSWTSCATTLIILNWLIIIFADPRSVRNAARILDYSRLVIFLFIVIASIASLVAVASLLVSERAGHSPGRNYHIGLAIATVVLSWWLIHTIFSVHYAHMYYDTDTDEGGRLKVGGLQFPHTEEPDYLDFVYFGFVIGMTFQVSDVEIADRKIRRMGLLHGVVAFAFNMSIIALTVNLISTLVGQ